MPKKIVAWQCAYCDRYRKTKSSTSRHEQICFGNPDRKILDGEQAIWTTMPNALIVSDSYGVEGSDFQEPNWYPPPELSEKYKWWPRDETGELGLGYVFKEGRWQKIKGYVAPHFAPGYSWKDEVVPEDIALEENPECYEK